MGIKGLYDNVSFEFRCFLRFLTNNGQWKQSGTVRRSTDGHFINANVDTDVLICEQSDYASTKKPEEMYNIVEHFCLGRRRIELFGEVN